MSEQAHVITNLQTGQGLLLARLVICGLTAHELTSQQKEDCLQLLSDAN